ncbi:hypothetical protein PQX77_000323 [Marasmius sp. AFHP31]|nr:hypothetical protein PQX77_000323 [Marasmius sp. AFHP31]
MFLSNHNCDLLRDLSTQTSQNCHDRLMTPVDKTNNTSILLNETPSISRSVFNTQRDATQPESQLASHDCPEKQDGMQEQWDSAISDRAYGVARGQWHTDATQPQWSSPNIYQNPIAGGQGMWHTPVDSSDVLTDVTSTAAGTSSLQVGRGMLAGPQCHTTVNSDPGLRIPCPLADAIINATRGESFQLPHGIEPDPRIPRGSDVEEAYRWAFALSLFTSPDPALLTWQSVVWTAGDVYATKYGWMAFYDAHKILAASSYQTGLHDYVPLFSENPFTHLSFKDFTAALIEAFDACVRPLPTVSYYQTPSTGAASYAPATHDIAHGAPALAIARSSNGKGKRRRDKQEQEDQRMIDAVVHGTEGSFRAVKSHRSVAVEPSPAPLTDVFSQSSATEGQEIRTYTVPTLEGSFYWSKVKRRLLSAGRSRIQRLWKGILTKNTRPKFLFPVDLLAQGQPVDIIIWIRSHKGNTQEKRAIGFTIAEDPRGQKVIPGTRPAVVDDVYEMVPIGYQDFIDLYISLWMLQ